jgi:hypothetical protein
MKNLFALTAIAAGLFFSTQASALTVVNIDNFSTFDQTVVDNTVNGVAVSESNATRTLSANLLAAVPAGDSVIARVTSGILDVTNGTLEDSEVKVDWNIAALALPADAINTGFYFKVVASDANVTGLEFLFNDANLQNFNIPGNTLNTELTFGLSAAELAAVSGGGKLTLKINGAPGWDLALDQFGFSYDKPSKVPEPTTLGLIGLGLAGMAAARKRKSA